MQTALPAQREHLTYCHVTSTEQDKPVSLPGGKRGRSTARGIDGGAGRRSERKRMPLCNGADTGCVCFIDNITERNAKHLPLPTVNGAACAAPRGGLPAFARELD